MPALAEAGAKLFQAIFYPVSAGGKKYERLNALGDQLRAETRNPMWFRITSDQFYAPWNLIYSGAIGEPPEKTSFWGYQHLVEHYPQFGSLEYEMKGAPPLKLGLHLDNGLDTEFRLPVTSPVSDLSGDFYDVELALRSTRELLRDALLGATVNMMITASATFTIC